MATVTKDFRIKSGLVVEGANATVDGSDIITEDALTGGTQTNIAVTYDPQSKTVSFVAENGIADSTTDNLTEGTTNKYFTDQRALDATASAYDPAGSAATAEQNANDYTNNAIAGISTNLAISADSGSGTITVGSETFTLNGGSGITTTISNDAVQIDAAVDNSTISIDQYGNLAVKVNSNNGLTLSNGLKVDTGDGLEIDNASGKVVVNTGFGLEIDGQGQVAVNAGNGIQPYGSDLAVDLPYIAQNIIGTANPSGLETEGPYSQLRVKAGDGIELNSNGVSVDTGYGLEIDGQGQLAVNNGYGITTFNQDVAVDRFTLAGDMAGFGLEGPGPSGKISVKAGNGINVDTNFGSSIEVALAADSGLDFNNGDLKVKAGNYITLDGSGVNVDKSSLVVDLAQAGTGLGVDMPNMGNFVLKVNVDNSTVEVNGSDELSVKLSDGLALATNGIKVDTDVIATKAYVDGAISGLDWKAAVNLLAASNVDVSASWPVGNIDGHAEPTSTYRVLLTAQSIDTENGIWEYVPQTLVWSRAADADTYQELVGAAVFVMEGTTYGSSSWVQSNHYLADFGGQDWTQFSGQGTYTAGNGLEINGNEFAIDDAVVVTHTELDGYLNSTSGSEGTTILYVQDYVATAIETGDATATPTYLALDINSVAKQVASQTTMGGTGFYAVQSWSKNEYRSAEFLVKVSYGTHTEISKVLLTLDDSDNIAITEYAVVGTNGSLSTISAQIEMSMVWLTVTPANAGSVATVVGTLLV